MLPKNVQLAVAVPIAGCPVEMLILTLELVETIRLRVSITLHKPLHHWIHLLMLLHRSFSAPFVAPSRALIDVAIDFDRAFEMLIRARERDDTISIAFYELIRRQYVEEQVAIVSGNVLQDK